MSALNKLQDWADVHGFTLEPDADFPDEYHQVITHDGEALGHLQHTATGDFVDFMLYSRTPAEEATLAISSEEIRDFLHPQPGLRVPTHQRPPSKENPHPKHAREKSCVKGRLRQGKNSGHRTKTRRRRR